MVSKLTRSFVRPLLLGVHITTMWWVHYVFVVQFFDRGFTQALEGLETPGCLRYVEVGHPQKVYRVGVSYGRRLLGDFHPTTVFYCLVQFYLLCLSCLFFSPSLSVRLSLTFYLHKFYTLLYFV